MLPRERACRVLPPTPAGKRGRIQGAGDLPEPLMEHSWTRPPGRRRERGPEGAAEAAEAVGHPVPLGAWRGSQARPSYFPAR